MIRLDPGFSPATIQEAKSLMASRGFSPADKFIWPIENRRTGAVECVVGPCTFDEMVETFTTLDEKPIVQKREVRR